MVPIVICGQTRVIAATIASQRATNLPPATNQLEVGNAGPGWVFLAYGREDAGNTIVAASPAAGLADYPIAPGHAKIITVGQANVVAVVSDAAGATVYLTPCSGF